MTLPTTFFGIFALLALLLPGVVYSAVRTANQGFTAADRVLGERILQAILTSVVLDAFYLIVLGNWLAPMVKVGEKVIIQRPGQVGWALLVLGVIIPALAGLVMYGRVPLIRMLVQAIGNRAPGWLVNVLPKTGYNSTPTAWDWVSVRKGGRWVRILTGEGRWLGGWFADESFVSVYPEPRDIYLAVQWIMSPEGEFVEQAKGASGVWLSLENAQLVEWTEPTADDAQVDPNARESNG